MWYYYEWRREWVYYAEAIRRLAWNFFLLIHIFVSKKFCLICENFEKILFNNVNLVNLFNLVELCKINQVGLV